MWWPPVIGLGAGDFTEYDDMGRQERHTTFDGRVIDSIYDQFGRLDKLEYFFESSDPDVDPADDAVDYEYDAFGRMIEVTDARGTVDMIFDNDGQLIEGTIFREYDDLGRIERMYTGTAVDPVNDTEYTYDELGRLSEVKAVEINNVVLGTPEITTYSYDVIGNLDRIDYANGMIADYQYDTLNRLELLTNYASDATPEDLNVDSG